MSKQIQVQIIRSSHEDFQASREIIADRKKFNWAVQFFLILLPIFLVALKSPAQQTEQKPNAEVSPTQKLPVEAKVIDTIPVIKGSIKDDKGQSVEFASVLIKGTGQGSMADKDGNFSLKLLPDSKFLIVSCIGYQMQTVAISNPFENMKIVLKPLIIDTTLGLVLVSKKFKRKKSTPITEEMPNSISIYPNPLPPYSTLNIEWKYPVEDNHLVEIYNLSNKLVQKKSLNITKKVSKTSMQLDVKMTGDYLLRIINTRTHKIIHMQLMVI